MPPPASSPTRRRDDSPSAPTASVAAKPTAKPTATHVEVDRSDHEAPHAAPPQPPRRSPPDPASTSVTSAEANEEMTSMTSRLWQLVRSVLLVLVPRAASPTRRSPTTSPTKRTCSSSSAPTRTRRATSRARSSTSSRRTGSCRTATCSSTSRAPTSSSGRLPTRTATTSRRFDGESRADQAQRSSRTPSGASRRRSRCSRSLTDPPGATVYLDRKDLGARGNTPREPRPRRRASTRSSSSSPATSPPSRTTSSCRSARRCRTSQLTLVPILGTVQRRGRRTGATVKLDTEDGRPCARHDPVHAPSDARPAHAARRQEAGLPEQDIPIDVPAARATSRRARTSRAQTGAVVVNTDIRDALITIDDQPSGFTPAVLNVPIGQHQLRVTLSGFRPVEQTIEVTKTGQVKLDLQLTTQRRGHRRVALHRVVEDAPASVTIITSQELRAMDYPTIAEAIRGVRGMYPLERHQLRLDRRARVLPTRRLRQPHPHPRRRSPGQRQLHLVVVRRLRRARGHRRHRAHRGHPRPGLGALRYERVLRRHQPDHALARQAHARGGAASAPCRTAWGAAASPDTGASARTRACGPRRPAAHGVGQRLLLPRARRPRALGNRPPAAHRLLRPAVRRQRARRRRLRRRRWSTAAPGGSRFTLQWFLNSRKKIAPSDGVRHDPQRSEHHFADTRGFLEARFEPKLSARVQLFTRAHVDMYDFDDVLGVPVGPAGSDQHAATSSDTYRGRWGGVEARVRPHARRVVSHDRRR